MAQEPLPPDRAQAWTSSPPRSSSCDVLLAAPFDPADVDAQIERAVRRPDSGLGALVAESEAAGLRLVRRLVDEWATGVNRFDRPGEGLFGAWVDGQLIGVCGLNVDPYTVEARVGRVRHLYVLSRFRRRGVGRRLIAEVVAAARGPFDTLRLRTSNPEAARLYEALGFRRSGRTTECTHVMALASAPDRRPEQ